jgi:hypothetical protein
MQSGYKEEFNWAALTEESSFETPVGQDMSLEHRKWTDSTIMARKELGGAKKTSCVILSYSETVINPLPVND